MPNPDLEVRIIASDEENNGNPNMSQMFSATSKYQQEITDFVYFFINLFM